MIYRKNIRRWERIARLAVGISMAIYGSTVTAGTPMGYVLIAAGLCAALSGIFGYCPACAMAGRKLPQPLQ